MKRGREKKIRALVGQSYVNSNYAQWGSSESKWFWLLLGLVHV